MRKKYIFLLFALIFFIKIVDAQQNEEVRRLMNRASAALDMKDYEGAVDELKKILDIEPDNKTVILAMGKIYEQIDNYSEALKAFRRYIVLDPQSADAESLKDKIYQLEYKLEKTTEKTKLENWFPGTWRSNYLTRRTSVAWWVLDIIEEEGQYRINLHKDCSGYNSEFISSNIDATKKGDFIVFLFTSDHTYDPQKGNQEAAAYLDAGSSLSSIAGNTAVGGIFGVLSIFNNLDAATSGPAVNTSETYIFALKLNPKTMDLEGRLRVIKKTREAGQAQKVISDSTYNDYIFTKDFTGTGKHTYKLNDGYYANFEGEFVNSNKSGHGQLVIYDSEGVEVKRFTGIWRNNDLSSGELIEKNGLKYTGEFSNYLYNGNGKLTFSNGNIIEGTFLKGVRDGFSKFTYKSGEIIEGNFVNGCSEGDFTFKFPCGDKCTFSFKNGAIIPKGSYVFSYGRILDIDFKDLASSENFEVFEKIKDKLAFVWYKAGSGKKNPEVVEKNKTRDRIYLMLAYLCAENGSIIKDGAWEACKNDPWINNHINSFPIPFLLKSVNNDRALKDIL
jgi:tetratricopeptide (TPR) repeat protein